MPAEYMQEERRGSALERTPNKRGQSALMNSGGLNRVMAHMLTVFKTSAVNIKTTNHNGHMQL